MDIDILTICVASAVLLLSIVAALASQFLRRPRVGDDQQQTDYSTPRSEEGSVGMSVVIASHNNAYELEKNLPAMLEQVYPNFEVIVVDESSTDETDDVLKRLKSQYSNLYTTFIPQSSHYLSRRKLALTVGVKAAKKEWVAFVDVASRPADSHWLANMAQHATDEHDIVMGYANYDDETNRYYRFRQLLNAARNIRKAQCSTAYASGGCAIAMRRRVFMDANGFQKNLEYLRGEYDFLVNEYAKPGRVAVAIEAVIVKDAPSKKSWINDNLYYMETRRHLRRSKLWRIPVIIDAVMLHVAFLADVLAMAVAVLTARWILLGAACVGLLLMLGLRTWFAVGMARSMGDKLSVLLVPLMELRMAWTHVALACRYRFSDKYDFIRK